jgi:hypothetical protein
VATVHDSDATAWFGDWRSPGGTLTLGTCRALGKPFLIVYNCTRPSQVGAGGFRVVNVAGNRDRGAR